MGEHFEPWRVAIDAEGTISVVADSDGDEVLIVDFADAADADPDREAIREADLEYARRIVACVNACRGIGSDRLEEIPATGEGRKALLAALAEEAARLSILIHRALPPMVGKGNDDPLWIAYRRCVASSRLLRRAVKEMAVGSEGGAPCP